jgi:hypothetical protein
MAPATGWPLVDCCGDSEASHTYKRVDVRSGPYENVLCGLDPLCLTCPSTKYSTYQLANRVIDPYYIFILLIQAKIIAQIGELEGCLNDYTKNTRYEVNSQDKNPEDSSISEGSSLSPPKVNSTQSGSVGSQGFI